MAILVHFAGCGKKVETTEFVRPIKSMRVGELVSDAGKHYSGVAKSTTEANLSFRVPGEIIELPVKTGDEVQKDKILAKLDPTDYQTKVNEAKAVYVQARADLERYRLLYEEENATKQELDVAQAHFDTANAQYDLAKQYLAYTVLKAPRYGWIASVPVEVHETVSRGQTICRFESGGVLEINLGLPESLIGQVRQGGPVEARFDAVANVMFDAIITKVGVRVDERTATFPVTVELTKEDNRLRSGMVAEVVFQVRSAELKEGQFLVPSQAVLEDSDGKRYVWVYDAETQTVRRREVKIGSISDAGVQVLSGLRGGEVIPTAGIHYLEEGQKVRLIE